MSVGLRQSSAFLVPSTFIDATIARGGEEREGIYFDFAYG